MPVGRGQVVLPLKLIRGDRGGGRWWAGVVACKYCDTSASKAVNSLSGWRGANSQAHIRLLTLEGLMKWLFFCVLEPSWVP